MSDDERWAFVTPWLNTLRPYANVKPTTRAHNKIVSIVDHVSSVRLCFRNIDEPLDLSPRLPNDADEDAILEREIDIKLVVDDMRAANMLTQAQLRALRSAMTIVGGALPLAPHLWASFPNVAWKSCTEALERKLRPLQPRSFRDDDLVPTFELMYDRDSVDFATWLTYVAELLIPMDADEDVAAAKRKLQRLDLSGIANTGPIGISLSLQQWPEGDTISTQLVTTLDSACRCGVQRWFNITHINLYAVELNPEVVATMARIRAMGIRIGELGILGARASAATHDALATLTRLWHTEERGYDDRMPRPPFVRCRLPDSGSYSLLLDANCPRNVVVDASSVRFSLDWLLCSRVLQAAVSHSDSFRFEFSFMKPSLVVGLQAALDTLQETHESPWYEARLDDQTTIGSALLEQHGIVDARLCPTIMGVDDALIRLPPDGCWIEVPIGALQDFRKTDVRSASSVGPTSVAISIGRCSATTFDVVLSWFSLCFPTHIVESLNFQIVCGVKWTRAKVTQLLTLCPKLHSLQLSHAEADVCGAFVGGYRDGFCQLEVLSVDECGVAFLPLVEELAIPATTAARTLREVRIGFPERDEDAFLQLLTAMLIHNRTLEFVEIVLFGQTIERAESIATTLSPFHREPLAIASRRRMPLRAKLAFLSVVSGIQTQGSEPWVGDKQTHPCTTKTRLLSGDLDRGVLAAVLGFGAPCLVRLIHLKAREVCNFFRGCGNGSTSYWKSVQEDAIEL